LESLEATEADRWDVQTWELAPLTTREFVTVQLGNLCGDVTNAIGAGEGVCHVCSTSETIGPSARHLSDADGDIRGSSAARRKAPILKSILSVVPAPRKIRRVGKAWGRALPIEFVELSRTESYGY